MIKVFIELLMGLRKVFLILATTIFDKTRDQKTGKIKNIKPTNLKNIFMWGSLILFLILAAVKINEQQNIGRHGSNNYYSK